MSRADAMKDSADAAPRDRGPGDDSAIRVASAPSWDPYEVWLTRVKQPRDRAAHVAAAESQAGRRPGPTRTSTAVTHTAPPLPIPPNDWRRA